MKNFVINSFVTKGDLKDRRNFMLKTDKTTEVDIKPIILDKLDINEDWIIEEEKWKLIESESVIIYEVKAYKNTEKKEKNKEKNKI